MKRVESKEAAAAGAGLSGLYNAVSTRVSALGTRAHTLYTRASPYVAWASDMSWAVVSSAVILALPVLVEIQREATVMVMQRQREREMAELQEQTRLQQGGMLEQLSSMTKMFGSGGAPGQQ